MRRANRVDGVKNERPPLELLAPALCTVGSLVALLAALFGSGRSKSGVLSAFLGTVGSAAWLATAVEAMEADRDAEPEAA